MRAATYPTPDIAVDAAAIVGEGPVIDDRSGRLCWVDIDRGELHESDLSAGVTSTASVGMMLGAAAPRDAFPGFAAAVQSGFGFIMDGALTVIDPCLPQSFLRMNDAKCDSRGRMWAGSTHLEFEPRAGSLRRWDGTGPSEIVAHGFTLPNGLGWNDADDQMYLADSFAHVLLKADYDGDTVRSEFHSIVTVNDGLPDGLAVDVDGCVWLAVWGAWEVRRYTSDGELVARIPMPVAQPSSCAFASDGTLYITSARAGLGPEALERQSHAGSVFAVATETRGVPVRNFAA